LKFINICFFVQKKSLKNRFLEHILNRNETIIL